MPRHDIAYSRSNDLTDRHAADKVLADKALGRVTARDSALSERATAAAGSLGSDESQDQDRHGHERR